MSRLLFYFSMIIFLIAGGIMLPIRRNYVQGSMGKKIFCLSVGVALATAVNLLQDLSGLDYYSRGANWISLSAGMISLFSGFSIVISDQAVAEWSWGAFIGFFGMFLGGTILSLLFGFKSLGSWYIGMGIYTLVLGAAEVGILWHKKKRLSERELNNANLPT